MTKAAAPLSRFFRGAHQLMRNGFWKTVARKTAPTARGWRGSLNRASRLFHNPNAGKVGADGLREGKSTLLSHGLNAYGLGGFAASMAGYDLPGSALAMNVTAPGLGAIFTAPSLVSSVRMLDPENQAKVVEDLKMGARDAVGDLTQVAQSDSSYLTRPDLYQQFMSQYAPQTANLSRQYSQGATSPMSAFGMFRAALSDPQAIVNNRIDLEIPNLLRKAGAEKSAMTALRAVGRGAGHVFPWLFPTLGVGSLGYSVLSDKPYDEAQVQERGYAGAQAALGERLKTINPFERAALRMDPTLLMQQAERVLPGTVDRFAQRTGQPFQPGLLSSIAQSWSDPAKNSYYEYDAAGARRYL